VLRIQTHRLDKDPISELARLTRSLALPRKSINTFHRELAALRLPGDFPYASVLDFERIAATGFPFSDHGYETLKARLNAWNDSRFAAPAVTAAHYTLVDFVLDRMIALAPDLPRNSAPVQSGQEGPEFHRDLGKLAFHPWLMQVLGLSLDLVVDDFLPEGEKVGLYVTSIKHPSRPELFEPIQQARAITLVNPAGLDGERDVNDGHPLELGGNAKYRGGCVIVSDKNPGESPRFELEQLDVDSTMEKVLGVAQTLKCQFESGVVGDQREATLAVLRTTGLSLLARKLDEGDSSRSARTSLLARAGEVSEFFADDLVIGYRPDLCELEPDERGGACRHVWKSLVARKLESLRIDGREFSDSFRRPPADEAFVAPHARILDGGNDQGVRLLFFEELFCWRGWSLAAPHVESGHRGRVNRASEPELIYSSGGALPRQRFGWGYRLGMRAVYIDGWSVSLAEGAAMYDEINGNPMLTLGTNQVGNQVTTLPYPRDQYFTPFFRYEGIQPANVVGGSPYESTSTERPDRMLVASDGHGRVLVDMSERMLEPPRIDLENAIRCGMFDRREARRKAPEGIDMPDPWAKRLIIGIYRRGDDQLQRLEYFDYYSEHDVWPHYRRLKIRAEADTGESLPDEGFETRWEGDALVFRTAPGITVTLRYWHEITERQLALSGVVEAMARWLMMTTPEATSVRAAFGLVGCDSTCDMRDALIQLLSQWHKRFPYDLRPYLAAGRAARDINLTSFSMLNPARELEIVHAVPIPARAPSFSQALGALQVYGATRLPATTSEIARRFEIVRERKGATVAEFRGDIEIQRASTERIDCFAEWDEVTDEIGTMPLTTHQRQPMFRADNMPIVLESAPTLDRGKVPLQRDAHANLVYGAESRPDLAPDNDLLMLDETRSGIGRMRNLDFSGVVPHYDFGDTKARLLAFSLRAASRYANDFPKMNNHARESEAAESRWLKATLPPAKPQVAFIVPLFGFDSATIGSMARQTRHSGWFRIWLERPWYSSGAGELLALVCWPQALFQARGGAGGFLTDKVRRVWGSLRDEAGFPPGQRPPMELERFYTGWGLDPIWDQPNVRLTYIPPGAFSNRMLPDMTTHVFPSQITNPTDSDAVALALYRPEYNSTERRWYVDVQITPPDDAYFPFLRFGLARYQPNAIQGCELSEVVTSEFVQLAPERSITVTVEPRSRDDWSKLRVDVAGPRTFGLSDPEHPGVETRMVIHLDEAVRFAPEIPRAWVPQRDSDGLEDVELKYEASSKLWRGEVRYKLNSTREYSVWLEEREGILIDSSPGASPRDDPVLGSRVTYADRVFLQTPH